MSAEKAGGPLMLDRRRKATLRLYTSAVRRGVHVPEMLTVDESFEAVVAGMEPVAKMNPYRETDPDQERPRESRTADTEPAEEETTEDEYRPREEPMAPSIDWRGMLGAIGMREFSWGRFLLASVAACGIRCAWTCLRLVRWPPYFGG